MSQLEILRESLGQCDEIILDALLMRNRIVEDIMAYKKSNDLPILQPEQEAKQKEWLEKRMEKKRHKAEVEDVFRSITMNSKRIQSRKLFNYNIVLIGFMGAGKSTISEFLKNSFAMEVIEMDQIIAEREGMTISDIFEVYGEQYFRNLETNLLIEMQSKTNVVISCGGGTPMRECNVVEMKKNGRVVLLTAKPETILDRVKDSHDRPLIVQYVDYLGGLLHGDLGTTLTDNQPVISILTHYGAATFELAFLALIVALIVGIGLGRLAARKRDRAADAGIRTFAILCYATPVFFLGLVLKLIFAVWLNILPASGRSDLNSEMQFTRLVSPTGFYIIDAIQLGDMNVLVDVLRHAVLPAVALGLLTAGVFIRLVRTNVISTYNSGYVEAARSRGVSEKRLLNKHAWRPALIPIITVMGMQIALMLAGAVLTETTFEWKGLGFMLSQYLKARDFVAVQGIVILIAIIVAVVNFLVDVIAALIDPRVRY